MLPDEALERCERAHEYARDLQAVCPTAAVAALAQSVRYALDVLHDQIRNASGFWPCPRCGTSRSAWLDDTVDVHTCLECTQSLDDA